MSVIYRWVAFGTPGIFHLDTTWRPPNGSGGEVRHEPMCGYIQTDCVVEPDGSMRCVRCSQLLIAGCLER